MSESPVIIHSLRKRADFLRLRHPDTKNGGRVGRRAFMLIYAPTPAKSTYHGQDGIRIGYTVTRQLGPAVTRNRIKRRLRAAVRTILPTHGINGYDYILIARKQALTQPFYEICAQLKSALVSSDVSRQKASNHSPHREGIN